MSTPLIPKNITSMIYGLVENGSNIVVDSELVLLAHFGDTPSPATPTPTSTPQSSSDDWVWDVTNTVGQIDGGCCDEQVVVVEGQNGLTAGSKKNLVVIETSTLPLKAKHEAYDALKAIGTEALDCPVSGSGAQAVK